MAGEAARAALELSMSASTSGFSVSLKIDNTILAGVTVLGAGALTAYYLAHRRPSENAIRNGLEERNETGEADPQVRSIETGSVIVELYCHTEHSLLQFVEDFEAKKVKRRLKEEFTKIGFHQDLDVIIINAKEVYKKVHEIRYNKLSHLSAGFGYLTIIRRRRSEYYRTPRRSRGDYSTIFTKPEEDNCFSIIAQVIIGATAFSFILLVKYIKKSRGGHFEN